ncbi:hypothetical protein NMY22_g1130 [Coprinellus aureogranulatus]|nr:hypothetical protein NMY22_g1130 [Coprinellus aureogranulatus]
MINITRRFSVHINPHMMESIEFTAREFPASPMSTSSSGTESAEDLSPSLEHPPQREASMLSPPSYSSTPGWSGDIEDSQRQSIPQDFDHDSPMHSVASTTTDPPSYGVATSGYGRRVYEFSQFLYRGIYLYSQKDWVELVSLILCGLDRGNKIFVSTEKQVVDFRQSTSMSRFYSTVIGVSRDIIIRDTLLCFDTSLSWKHALTGEQHISYNWEGDQGPALSPLHEIPNMRLGTFGEDGSIFILLPRLHSASRRSYRMSFSEYRAVWEVLIIPCLRALGEERLDDGLDPHHIAKFSHLLRVTAMSCGVKWLAHLRFVHLIRGRSSPHPFDADSSNSALDHYLQSHGLSSEAVRQDMEADCQWFVDVGVEISAKGYSMAWRSDSHFRVYQQMTGTQLDASHSQYERLPFSHIMGASGCRIGHLNHRAGLYAELTTRDGSLQAVRECGNRVDRLGPLDILNKPSGSLSFLSRLTSAYLLSNTDMEAQATLRVPFESSHGALLNLDADAISTSCLAFDTREISLWRSIRAAALNHIIETYRANVGALITRNYAATLLINTIPWFLSSSHAGDLVISSDTKLVPPVNVDSGVLFFCPITSSEDRADVPHLADIATLEYSYHEPRHPGSRDTIMVLDAFHQPNSPVPVVPPPQPAPLAHRKFRATIPCVGGVRSTGLYEAQGSTLGDPHLESPIHGPHPLNDSWIAGVVGIVIGHFYLDVHTSAMNSEACAAFLRHDIEVPGSSLTNALYQSNLAVFFRAVNWKHSTHNEWRRAFDRFFPEDPKANRDENMELSACQYYQAWARIASAEFTSLIAVRSIRRAIWETVFSRLYWVPACEATRVWSIAEDRHYKSFASPPTRRRYVSSPKVLINGLCDPTFDEDGVPGLLGR